MKTFENVKVGDIIKPEDEEYKHLVKLMYDKKIIDCAQSIHMLHWPEHFEGVRIDSDGLTPVKKNNKE